MKNLTTLRIFFFELRNIEHGRIGITHVEKASSLGSGGECGVRNMVGTIGGIGMDAMVKNVSGFGV